MAEVGENGKEEVFPCTLHRSLAQGVARPVKPSKLDKGFGDQTCAKLTGEAHRMVEAPQHVAEEMALCFGEWSGKLDDVGMGCNAVVAADCRQTAQCEVCLCVGHSFLHLLAFPYIFSV